MDENPDEKNLSLQIQPNFGKWNSTGDFASTSLGYDVTDVREQGLSGVSDEEVLDLARRTRRIVVTFDRDFADTQEFPLGSHPGVIRLRIIPQTTEILHPILRK